MAAPVQSLPHTSDLTGRRLGRYEVLSLLASGGMATVYVARAQGVAGFERLVAIKVLHPHLAHDADFISMFLDEARLAARIRHPNAVGTLDISDTQGDGYFLVMEYVEGDHFGALLRSAAKGGERLPVNVVSRILMDALSGLNAAHRLTGSSGEALGLVHRDVSPHNILIGADGVGRITDFGVAKAEVRLSSTRDGQFKGKLSYMAPEQASAGVADQRSDLFSMGIVLWEALTGRRLFRGENNADVLNKILNPDAPAPSTFDPSLAPFDPVLAKTLAKDPADRYQTAEDFLEAIEEAAAAIGGVATPRAVAREVTKWLGDKIDAERLAIRDAMEAMGRSELTPGVLPRPMDGGSQPSQPQSRVRPIAGEDMTVGAKPSTVEMLIEPAPPARRSPLLFVVIALFLVAGGGGAWALFGAASTNEDGATAPGATEADDGPAGDVARERRVERAATERAAAERAAAAEAAAEANAEAAAAEATAEQAAEDRAEEDEAADDARGAARRARLRRQRAQNRGREVGEVESPRGSGGSSDDDLMLNPYRR